ncbi:hypothetical protein, partial [Mycobacterium marinum]|uniref:hypothetical protein n=1 Tax=Mycobacterium marinum TaxID=1781 RepID=UPI001CA5C646
PPRPEALMHGILKLRQQIQLDPALGWRTRYGATDTVEVLPEEGDALMKRADELTVMEPGAPTGA